MLKTVRRISQPVPVQLLRAFDQLPLNLKSQAQVVAQACHDVVSVHVGRPPGFGSSCVVALRPLTLKQRCGILLVALQSGAGGAGGGAGVGGGPLMAVASVAQYTAIRSQIW